MIKIYKLKSFFLGISEEIFYEVTPHDLIIKIFYENLKEEVAIFSSNKNTFLQYISCIKYLQYASEKFMI